MVSWNAPDNLYQYGYEVSFGTNGGSQYIVEAGTNTSVVVTNLSAPTYIFTVRDYIVQNGSYIFSGYSPSFSMTPNLVYVGERIDYGVTLLSLSSQNIYMRTFADPPIGQGYRASLVVTNQPFAGLVPLDGNSYKYLGAQLQYGTNLAALTTEQYQLLVRTNSPNNEFYRGSLIITNQQF